MIKFVRSDLALMRVSLIAFAISITLSAGLYTFSENLDHAAQKELKQARSKANDAKNRLSAAQEDRENMSIYTDEYGTLMAQKIIGGDRRLDWVDSFERLRQMGLVQDFSYEIGPQRTYQPDPALDSGNYDMLYSDTQLKFTLLHEEQLLNFFTALRSRIKGWFHVEGCSIQPPGSTSSDAPLQATCKGGWVTLKNRNMP